MGIYPYEGIFPKIHDTAFVHPDAVVIGDVEIGPESSIWPGVVIRGDVNFIRIGTRTSVQDGSVLHVTRISPKLPEGIPLLIGDNVTIGHRVVLHACTIHDKCLIGIGAVVLDRCLVGEGAIVGSCALIPPGKVVEPGALWMGAPAQLKRMLSPEEIEESVATATNYVKLAYQYQATHRLLRNPS